ncbi:hypothetical protein BSZ39_03220 [Bowdeniella nasicola]|uniref:Signal transduction histidine kinase subgroup 3 dimerisation and phosphoacceptor domain-containing protein n=1 Tax=Bowdeniella nasicola TaxID=208480 RepID=A0A1Q5Q490_9ACTO|nr:histidine kinase [Bowdeniella nasicola]OKL54623.1 hypothetical protein BSZ39_03220 [Bowdeniella nasicola]
MLTRPSKERIMSLGWSAPYLVFLAMPIVQLVRMWDGSPRAYGIGLLLVAFAATYLSAWLLADVVPLGRRINKNVIIVVILLVLIQVGLWLLTDWTMIYLLSYAISLTLLLPRRALVGYLLAVAAIAFVQAIIEPNTELWVPFAILAMNMFIMIAVRGSIVSDRQQQVATAQQHALAKEQQRLQLASDLHDVLGQQLTAISVKAELLTRLITAEQASDKHLAAARSEAGDVSDLARQALTDVRAVVAKTRQARLSDEIEQARALLKAAGISCTLETSIDIDELDPSSIVGRFAPYVIREGCANVVHHAADPTQVRIEVDSDRVSVSDNGAAASPRDARAGGSGLNGLRDRVGDHGRTSWGPRSDGPGWRLELAPAPVSADELSADDHVEVLG